MHEHMSMPMAQEMSPARQAKILADKNERIQPSPGRILCSAGGDVYFATARLRNGGQL
jgi:hypothetical protein